MSGCLFVHNNNLFHASNSSILKYDIRNHRLRLIDDVPIHQDINCQHLSLIDPDIISAFFIVATDTSPQTPPRFTLQRLVLYHPQTNKCTALDTKSMIHSIHVSPHLIAVQTRDTILLYSFKTIFSPRGTSMICSGENPPDSCDEKDPNYMIYSNQQQIAQRVSISPQNDYTVLAFADPEPGTVIIRRYRDSESLHIGHHRIKAHRHHIQNIHLSPDGELLATASVSGTTIRIFSTMSGKELGSFQRSRIGRTSIVVKIAISNTRLDGRVAISVLCSNHSLHHYIFQVPSSLTSSESFLSWCVPTPYSMAVMYLPDILELNENVEMDFDNERQIGSFNGKVFTVDSTTKNVAFVTFSFDLGKTLFNYDQITNCLHTDVQLTATPRYHHQED